MRPKEKLKKKKKKRKTKVERSLRASKDLSTAESSLCRFLECPVLLEPSLPRGMRSGSQLTVLRFCSSETRKVQIRILSASSVTQIFLL